MSTVRISTSPTKWRSECATMTAQGYYLVARNGEIYWESVEE